MLRFGSFSSACACALVLAACSSVHDDLSRQLLRPPHGWLASPADFGIAAEPFEIRLHSEASLTGFWIPHPAAHGRTVVLLHEEATNASAQHPYYRFLHEAGFHVLVLDPRGFGKSRGTPTLRAWLYDLNEVFDWLHERADVDRTQIALFGTSMGSVAAMWAARTHPACRAVIFEHLPSLRDMLRESTGDDGSALSAYRIGAIEFGLPEDIEPSDNAPRVKARALFVATENELERNRKSLLRAYAAYAGIKDLWLVPGTAAAPHAMLTLDQDYCRTIAAFLTAAFAGDPQGLEATIAKVSDASDGEAWYEIGLLARATRHPSRFAVEACAVLADGKPHYARTWLEGNSGSVRIKLPEPPMLVSATIVLGAVADEEATFVRPQSHLSRSGAAVADLWPRIEELRNGKLSVSSCRLLGADLKDAAEGEPFHPQLEAELADVFAKIGEALAGSSDEALRAQAVGWLERAVAAEPAQPPLHFWPGPVPTYGYPQEDAVRSAKQRLKALGK